MDLEAIAETLAKKNNLSKDEFLDRNLASVYQAKDSVDFNYWYNEFDRVENRVLISLSNTLGELDSNLISFIGFIEEINPYLATENFELIYVAENYQEGQIDETDVVYLTLIDNTKRDIKELKQVQTETDLILYSGGQVAACLDAIWFTSEKENPKLRDVFKAIQEGYTAIKNSE
jgi:hypothetical protein